MADLATPHYAFSIPDPDDPLGGIADTVTALALQVELKFRRTNDAAASVTSITDTTLPSASNVYENLASGGSMNFVAPATVNGRVRIHCSCVLDLALTANVFRQLWVSAAIIDGPSTSPGSEIHAAGDDNAVMVGIGATSGMRASVKASFEFISPTLTPGNNYHARFKKKISTNTNANIIIGSRTMRIYQH